MGIIKKNKIAKMKSESSLINSRNKFTKVDKCCICGKKMSSACNSHVVPQFILKNISEKGLIAYGNALSVINFSGLNKITGINNAHTFKLICKECDRNLFKNYENKDYLVNFDRVDNMIKNRMLCEMAVKANLSHLNMKYGSIVFKDMVTGGELEERERRGAIFKERIEMNNHFDNIYKLIDNIKKESCPFRILLNTELDYKTKIATQTMISFNYDLQGNQIFNYRNISYFNHLSWFYLMILPFDDKTRVIFYIDNDDYAYVSDLINQFESLSISDQIHFLFIALILHDEQFYVTPSFLDKMKKDKKIVRIYNKSEYHLKHTRVIKDFKKYNNYLNG